MTNDEDINIVLGTGVDSDYQESYNDADYDSSAYAQPADVLNAKIRLFQDMDNMSVSRRRTFIKLLQYRCLSEALDAVSNLKSTPLRVWKSVIGKLNAVKGMSAGEDPSGKDFNKTLEKIIPIIGCIAGLCLALKQAEKAEAEASEPDDNEDFPDLLTPEKTKAICEKIHKDNISKSVVLQMCSNKTNGFSLNG